MKYIFVFSFLLATVSQAMTELRFADKDKNLLYGKSEHISTWKNKEFYFKGNSSYKSRVIDAMGAIKDEQVRFHADLFNNDSDENSHIFRTKVLFYIDERASNQTKHLPKGSPIEIGYDGFIGGEDEKFFTQVYWINPSNLSYLIPLIQKINSSPLFAQNSIFHANPFGWYEYLRKEESPLDVENFLKGLETVSSLDEEKDLRIVGVRFLVFPSKYPANSNFNKFVDIPYDITKEDLINNLRLYVLKSSGAVQLPDPDGFPCISFVSRDWLRQQAAWLEEITQNSSQNTDSVMRLKCRPRSNARSDTESFFPDPQAADFKRLFSEIAKEAKHTRKVVVVIYGTPRYRWSRALAAYFKYHSDLKTLGDQALLFFVRNDDSGSKMFKNLRLTQNRSMRALTDAEQGLPSVVVYHPNLRKGVRLYSSKRWEKEPTVSEGDLCSAKCYHADQILIDIKAALEFLDRQHNP